MRVDSFGPKTWLLAALAAWAFCVWALALFGLGERLGEAATDAAPQRLPGALPVANERLGPMPQYAEIGARPLFSENRRPQPFTIDGSGGEVAANPFDFTLTSVLMTPQAQVAILRPAGDVVQPVRVKMGEAVQTAPQWTLASLNPRSAVFRGPEGEKTLELRVFDGVGGAMPPPVSAGMPNAPQPIPGANGIPQTVQGGGIPSPPMPPPGQGMPIAEGVPPPPPPQQAVNSAGDDVSSQAQLEAIRKRIEARRAQLRQQAAQNQNNAPARPPGDTP
jgi:general secretion pathway protein N